VAKKSRPLPGKVVAITGGARGIGRATAATLVARGARVAIGDLDAALAERVAAELGGGVIGLQLDVTSRDSFAAFLDDVEHRLGPLDVLVNNAGIQPIGEFARERDAVTERVLDVNLGGTALGCKLALERLLPRDTGHIVNLASALGRTAVPGGASYCASKYAVVGLTEALRAELAATNVELHLVLPGFVDTEMSSGLKALRGTHRTSPADVGAAIADALQSGRGTVWVPAVLGPLVSLQPVTPKPLVAFISGLLGSGRLLTEPDALERAAYEARIAPPADRAAVDPALTVANAAASVADAVRAGDRGGG
jgi:NAD(P)-dependent dehydrogenase (short-subunit alcohol dehydrogenase family)